MINLVFPLLFTLVYVLLIGLRINNLYYILLSFLTFYIYTSMPLGIGAKEVSLIFGLDSVSYSLILLRFWIVILIILSSRIVWDIRISPKQYIILIIILLLSLVIRFSSRNIIIFYFFFEFSLIPTLFMIIGWGYQPERTQAGIYFLFYTLTASLPLLLGLFFISRNFKTINFLLWDGLNSYFSLNYFLIFSFIIAFLVKIPIFLTHLWLPKAHVEAPVAGSIILAGVLLKLGGFGLIRFIVIFYEIIYLLSSYIIGLALIRIFYVGLICCRIFDLKALIAYSSVSHIALIICGLYTYNYWGRVGCLAIIIAHGITSSGLFCLVNIYYERSHSRRIYLNKGLILTSSLLSLIIFILCAGNISAPPTINLLSEILLIGRVMSFDLGIILVFPLGSFIGTVYIFYIFSYSQHGKIFFIKNFSYSYRLREYFILAFHILPLNFLIILFYIFL